MYIQSHVHYETRQSCQRSQLVSPGNATAAVTPSTTTSHRGAQRQEKDESSPV
ncbi:predicted protein [Plenodomus lingam JN3]|uniref:Predicted protein n=1 Tax=Leptosphaeria maculans (strain JN3 / isolate v23.1.3 / race Av1-4-5-6-7-8) TaxID=985895 RepID=E4ZR88_LEPMJ|nr:predicted protein [Plenodomus lingam JN3]CBX93753.1 predicted protein [Plenodomus lingam JN3]